MSAADRLKTGDLDGALADLTAEVKAAPQIAKHRIFLFPASRHQKKIGNGRSAS